MNEQNTQRDTTTVSTGYSVKTLMIKNRYYHRKVW